MRSKQGCRKASSDGLAEERSVACEEKESVIEKERAAVLTFKSFTCVGHLFFYQTLLTTGIIHPLA